MKNTILVAGGTGNLGGRIVRELIKRGTVVRTIARPETDSEKIDKLKQLGAEIVEVDMSNAEELKDACEGASCVVSALSGLHETIVDAQTQLLDAAIAVNVPRFIPSDFAADFTRLPEGNNRNFDLRKEFHKTLDGASISSTSIMNGAFADILAYNTPFYNLKENSVGYWGDDPDFHVDFTTKDDTAAYTAAAALDPPTPKVLHIASFQISANELAAMATEIKKTEFKLVPMGSLYALSAYNKKERAAHPEGENELYPNWQGSQYMHSMFSVKSVPLDNGRYPDVTFTSAHDVLAHI